MRRPDYESRSEEAAVALVDDGTPLQDSIVKIAKRDSMNPEQIKRLVEMSNTASFLRMFGKTAGSEDRMVDFDVADHALRLNPKAGPSFGAAGGRAGVARD